MINKRKLTTLGLALSLGLGFMMMSACETEPGMNVPAKNSVTFSFLSDEKSQDLEVLVNPLIADMRKQTGLDVKAYYASNYTALIEAMRFNQVQAGWFSNLAGLEAVRRANGEVFAHTTYPNGVEGYQSIIITKSDSKLTADEILKCNKTLNFGMGDVKSTSGTLAPLTYFFLPAKKDPSTCFKNVRSANHQANIEAVIAGVEDAATNNSTALMELKERFPDKLAKIKVIWSSPLLPTDMLIYRKDMDPATKEKLRSFFLTYGMGEGPEAARQRKVLAGLQWGPFKPDDNSHLIPVRLMEATSNLMAATNSGDKAAMAKAQDAVDKVRSEAKAFEAKRPVQAAPDPGTSASSAQ